MSANAVPVTVAMPAYHHTHEIVSGAVALAGMSPTFAAAGGAEADIVDMPLLDYLIARETGQHSFTAVPAFPARAFIHSWIHVPTGEPPQRLPDTRTATVYARGLLSDRGEATENVIVAPPSALHGAAVRSLFERAGELERADYRRTGVYPILSVIAIRTELLERERWLASNVFRGFEVARRRYFARLQDIRGSRVPIPSVAGHLRAVAELVGSDLWPYGTEQSRVTLEAFIRHAAAQGLIEQAPADVAELFADVEPFVDYTDGQ